MQSNTKQNIGFRLSVHNVLDINPFQSRYWYFSIWTVANRLEPR